MISPPEVIYWATKQPPDIVINNSNIQPIVFLMPNRTILVNRRRLFQALTAHIFKFLFVFGGEGVVC